MKLTEKKINDVVRKRNTTNQSSYIVGGGSSTLKQLSDTAIANESNGDVLVYNSTSEKWENKEKAPKAEEADKVPWTGVEDVISGGTGAKNEFNICDATPDNSRMWINYRGRQGSSLTSAITEYLFGNGQGARTNVTVRAYNFFADSALSIVSDARKKEVTDDQMVLDIDAIAEAPSVLFRWRDSDDKTEHVGTIAQYWQKILPQVVLKDKDGMLSMDYSTAALVATISIARELRKIKEILQRNELR